MNHIAAAPAAAEAMPSASGAIQLLRSITATLAKGGGGGAMSEASVPIQPGQLAVTVTVNLTYVIE